ncbi:MAG TPA: hypothetical protein PK225_09780 [Azonexus sp.]|nr:hypothetical protein [Azonexus sp.]
MPTVRLDDCPIGLFRAANGELCVMTEYATQTPGGPIQRDAYIVSSGEYFWGGAKSTDQRRDVPVTPVDVDDALREAERFMAYFAGETGNTFYGPGTPQSCLATIRAALSK